MEIKRITMLSFTDGIQVPKAVLDDMMERTKAKLPGVEIVYVCSPSSVGAGELLEKIDDADVFIGMSNAFPGLDKIIAFPSLKWAHSFISGVDGFVKGGLTKRGVKISCTKGVHGEVISDQILAFIYAFIRDLPFSNANQHKRVNAKINPNPNRRMTKLAGKTVGIVGMGLIGTETARKLKLLDCRVLGMKRTPGGSEWVDKMYLQKDLNEMLPECDFVVMINPLTAETHHMMGFEQFALMKKTAIYINCARGAIHDQDALMDALRTGKIAGAALDAAWQGDPAPMPEDDPLWDFENVIYTPHIANQGVPPEEYVGMVFNLFVENIDNFLEGKPLIHEFLLDRGY